MKIVITVPHNKCPIDYEPKKHDHRYHPCDCVAAPVAEMLKNKLKKKNYEVVIVYGNKIRRTEVDLNRPEGRDTIFRDKTEKEIQNADLLIDCHSFPKDSAKYQQWEVVVFQSPYDKEKQAHKLYEIMKDLGINVAFQPAFTRDSIINDFAKDGHLAILIEHNEDLDTEMLTDFEVEAIDEFLTGKKSKMSIILQVMKESSAKKKKFDDEEELWLLEDTTKKLGQ